MGFEINKINTKICETCDMKPEYEIKIGNKKFYFCNDGIELIKEEIESALNKDN